MRRAVLVAAMVALAGVIAAPPAAAQGIVIVTAIDSPIADLSKDQAEQLFLGRRTSLDRAGDIALIDLPQGATRDQFYFLLTGKNPIQTRAYWSRQVFTGRARPPREAADLAEARELIAGAPGVVGYLPAAVTDPRLRVLLRLP